MTRAAGANGTSERIASAATRSAPAEGATDRARFLPPGALYFIVVYNGRGAFWQNEPTLQTGNRRRPVHPALLRIGRSAHRGPAAVRVAAGVAARDLRPAVD